MAMSFCQWAGQIEAGLGLGLPFRILGWGRVGPWLPFSSLLSGPVLCWPLCSCLGKGVRKMSASRFLSSCFKKKRLWCWCWYVDVMVVRYDAGMLVVWYVAVVMVVILCVLRQSLTV